MVWLKTLLFALFVPGVTLGLVPEYIRRGTIADPPPEPLRWLGALLVAAGVSVMAACFARFARARGTPAPIDPPKELVASGLYRWVRNPMYVGAVTILAGQALWAGSRALALYAVAFWAACHLFVVLYEEPHLAHTFGDSYAAYRRAVPRWLPRRPDPAPGVAGAAPAHSLGGEARR